MKCWIFAGNSAIGKLTEQQLLSKKRSFISTSRKHADKNKYYFDLRNFSEIQEISFGDTAVICCGITDIQNCQKYPDLAFQTNVDAIKHLMLQLSKKRIYFVFISSSSIFEGQQEKRTIESLPSPISIYAQTKVKIENFCKEEIKRNFAILRLTKVITPDWPLIKFWRNKIENGETIEPFSNRYFSPINGIAVAHLIEYLTYKQLSGTFQVGGAQEMTYSDFCFKLFRNNTIPENLINPIVDNDEFREKVQTPNLVNHLPKSYNLLNRGFEVI